MAYWNENRSRDMMRYEDNSGKVYSSEELDGFALWELEDMGIHVSGA